MKNLLLENLATNRLENTLRYSATLLLQCITINSSGSSLSFPSAEPISLARLIQFSSDSFRRIHYNLDKIPVTGWWNTDCRISATALKSKVPTNQPKPQPILVNTARLQTTLSNTLIKQWVRATDSFFWSGITERKKPWLLFAKHIFSIFLHFTDENLLKKNQKKSRNC